MHAEATRRSVIAWVALVLVVLGVTGPTARVIAQGRRGAPPAARPAPLSLPDVFTANPPSDEPWTVDVVPVPRLRVGVAHPPAWELLPDVLGVAFITRTLDDSTRAFLLPPTATPIQTSELGTAAELRQAGEVVAAAYKPRQLVAVGQARVIDRLWVWFDLGVASAAAVGGAVAPEAAPFSHLWIFSTVVDGQQAILCFVASHREDNPEVWAADARRAGPTFMRILQSMTFTREP